MLLESLELSQKGPSVGWFHGHGFSNPSSPGVFQRRLLRTQLRLLTEILLWVADAAPALGGAHVLSI